MGKDVGGRKGADPANHRVWYVSDQDRATERQREKERDGGGGEGTGQKEPELGVGGELSPAPPAAA